MSEYSEEQKQRMMEISLEAIQRFRQDGGSAGDSFRVYTDENGERVVEKITEDEAERLRAQAKKRRT